MGFAVGEGVSFAVGSVVGSAVGFNVGEGVDFKTNFFFFNILLYLNNNII